MTYKIKWILAPEVKERANFYSVCIIHIIHRPQLNVSGVRCKNRVYPEQNQTFNKIVKYLTANFDMVFYHLLFS